MLALVNAEAEDVNLKNCALGGSIILSTGGSTFVSAEEYGAKFFCSNATTYGGLMGFRFESVNS